MVNELGGDVACAPAPISRLIDYLLPLQMFYGVNFWILNAEQPTGSELLPPYDATFAVSTFLLPPAA